MGGIFVIIILIEIHISLALEAEKGILTCRFCSTYLSFSYKKTKPVRVELKIMQSNFP